MSQGNIRKSRLHCDLYNPFGNYKSPSLTAAKTNDDGSYFKITYQSKKQATTKADSKGIDIKILYLPSFTSVTRTDWKDDVKLIMKNSLKFDIPYFNMGVIMINADNPLFFRVCDYCNADKLYIFFFKVPNPIVNYAPKCISKLMWNV